MPVKVDLIEQAASTSREQIAEWRRVSSRRSIGLFGFPVRGRLAVQQLLGLAAESQKFFVLRRVLVHPCDGLVIPSAGIFFVIELRMPHRQEKNQSLPSPPCRNAKDLFNAVTAPCQFPARYCATPSLFQISPARGPAATACSANCTAAFGLCNRELGFAASSQANSFCSPALFEQNLTAFAKSARALVVIPVPEMSGKTGSDDDHAQQPLIAEAEYTAPRALLRPKVGRFLACRAAACLRGRRRNLRRVFAAGQRILAALSQRMKKPR